MQSLFVRLNYLGAAEHNDDFAKIESKKSIEHYVEQNLEA